MSYFSTQTSNNDWKSFYALLLCELVVVPLIYSTQPKPPFNSSLTCRHPRPSNNHFELNCGGKIIKNKNGITIMSMRTFHNEKFEGNQYIPQSKQFVDSDPILALPSPLAITHIENTFIITFSNLSTAKSMTLLEFQKKSIHFFY